MSNEQPFKYALSADNKFFLATRFLAASPEELSAPYRRIVKPVFNPDRETPGFCLRSLTSPTIESILVYVA